MNRPAGIVFQLVLIAALTCAAARSAAAGEPTEQIRGAISQGVEIMNGARLDNSKQRAEIISRLRKIVYPLFDFQEMAKRSLGPHWRRLDPQKQKEFVTLFTDLLERTYADKIDLYDGQKVAYTGETLDNDYAEVATKITSKKGDSFNVNYKLHLVNGKWSIYDVVVENISVVNNYRSQFNRVIVNASMDELFRRLKEKTS